MLAWATLVRRTRQLAAACVSASLLAALVAVGSASAAVLPPANPAANTPDPADATDCVVQGTQVVSGPCAFVDGTVTWNTPALSAMMLQAIDTARSREQLGDLLLPSNFALLPTNVQLLVLLNAERRSRGLPAITGLLPALNTAAATGAAGQTDPDLAAWPAAWGSVWGEATDLLEVWFGWMYDDGWGGSAAATENLDCTGAAAAGCWAHRDILLGDFGPHPVAGLAVTTLPNGEVSAAIILTSAAQAAPAGGALIPSAKLLGQATGPGVSSLTPTVSPAAVPPAGFNDIASVPWAVPSISVLQLAGVVDGIGGGRFGPGQPVSYAQLATMAGRLFAWAAEPWGAPGSAPSWAAGYLGYAIIQGYLPFPFTLAPTRPMPRGQVVALLQQAGGLAAGPAAATSLGLLCGLPDGLDLTGSVDRAQAAVFLERAAWIAHSPTWGVFSAQYSGNGVTLTGANGSVYSFTYNAGC